MEDGYSARGWLGIITAGALWVPLYEARSFDVGIDQLVQQIRHALPADEEDGDEEGLAGGEALFTAAEMKEELERLRADMEAASARPKAVGRRSGEQQKTSWLPCDLPTGVPPLPSGLRVSSEMRQLGLALLSATSRCRVGFCGMGGVGKTTVSSWLVRRDDVRNQFDAIAWVPLGQTPNIGKCQEQLHLQLTGSELAPELDPEERHELLRNAMHGVKLLLVLDDLWEAAHEGELQFVDEAAGGKVLISSRVRGLLGWGGRCRHRPSVRGRSRGDASCRCRRRRSKCCLRAGGGAGCCPAVQVSAAVDRDGRQAGDRSGDGRGRLAWDPGGSGRGVRPGRPDAKHGRERDCGVAPGHPAGGTERRS